MRHKSENISNGAITLARGAPRDRNIGLNIIYQLELMIEVAAVTKPARIVEPYGWAGHIPFAFWVMKALAPRVYVELGTHTGNSYFAFCQSVHDNRLPTRCYAVDTWRGDEHAGYYSDEIYRDVSNYNERQYSGFSRLLRMPFDEALGAFSDHSIDLLHIDGLHTYEAVRHNFENWLPKMSDSGVVLFHDITVRGADFGVWKFWEEVSPGYPHLSFDHSHGLGVLVVGKNVPPAFSQVLREFGSIEGQDHSKAYFERLGKLVEAEYRLRVLQEVNMKLGFALKEEHACLEEVQNKLDRMMKSSSWRITQPWRRFTKSFRKKSRRIRSLLKGKKQTRKENGYDRWLEMYDVLGDESRKRIQSEISAMEQPPLISVVMPVYNPDPAFLKVAMDSVVNQLYPHWELCIADDHSPDEGVRELIRSYAEKDSRIRYVFRTTNGHISEASNSAIQFATGSFMALLDHDDQLHELALFYVAREIHSHPEADLIYTDEDKIDENGRRYNPYFKSDFNYDLFLNHNMISHLGVYRLALIREIGGFRKGFEGSQDYDLALRMIEKISPEKIQHIPKVLYHWRAHQESTAATIKAKPYALIAAMRAIDEHLQRRGISATVESFSGGTLRVRYAVQDPLPSVEIVVLTRDKSEVLKTCIESIVSRTTYRNYTVTIVDNGSVEPETMHYFESLQSNSGISVVRDDSPFNFPRLNNNAVRRSTADFVCLLNNDTEVITPEWLEEMLGHAVQPWVGAVGAKLWYPNKTLQHGGIITGLVGIAGHAHKFFEENNPGYFGRAGLQQSFSAVTAACMLVRRSTYLEVHGLDEEHLQVAYNDVDFCLRLIEAGYRNVWTPYAELYHHESLTRGYEDTPEKQLRFQKEITYMQQRWGDILPQDPVYNPNLTLESEDFALAWPPRTDRELYHG